MNQRTKETMDELKLLEDSGNTNNGNFIKDNTTRDVIMRILDIRDELTRRWTHAVFEPNSGLEWNSMSIQSLSPHDIATNLINKHINTQIEMVISMYKSSGGGMDYGEVNVDLGNNPEQRGHLLIGYIEDNKTLYFRSVFV